jgi:branched-subunit amino acid ABC-type transport system permease component
MEWLDPNVLLPQIMHGVVFGAALGLLAMGLTVVFGLLGVMNFAHGEMLLWGAYLGYTILLITDNFWLALLLAPVGVAVIGGVMEVSTLRPLYKREPLHGLILTFGLAMALRELVRPIWGKDTLTIKPNQMPDLAQGAVSILGLTYPTYRIMVFVFSVVVMLGLWLFFTRTRAGIIVRAAVQDSEMLDGLGVNVSWVFTFTFAASAALAAFAGVLLAQWYTVYPTMGVEMILVAFIVVILGGMGSIGGSVVAALLIGVVSSLLALKFNPQRASILVFAMMILVLIWRPRGLFGKEGVLE